MIALHELRPPTVALDWHEAVAVVAALAALVEQAGATACPQPSEVELRPGGDLRVAGPGVIAGTAAQGLAALLSQLLAATPCPAELRQLVDTHVDDPDTGADAVARLKSRLAFFERPGRAEVLAALALRALPAVERARSTAALDALTARTRQPSGAHDRVAAPVAASTSVVRPARVRERPPAGEPGGGPGRLVLAGGIVFLLCLAVAFVAASWLDAPAPPHRAAAGPPEEDLPISGPGPGEPPARARAPQNSHPANGHGAGPSLTPAGTPSGVSSAPAGTPAAPAPASTAPTPAPTPTARTPVDVVVAEGAGRALPPAVDPVRPPPRVPPAGRVFSQADAQVTPAVLIRPHLPEQPPPDVPDEQIGTLEFIVAESGAVEHVHLISPANRYQERMIVAAAKTWLFQPAMRDGRPVRYRTRIRVTL
jgi:hypothetical protein